MLHLSSHFQSDMVIAQQGYFVVRGRAAPGARVRIQLERSPLDDRAILLLDQQYGVVFDRETNADGGGIFQMEVPAPAASFDPHQLSVSSVNETIQLTGILFGEVWLCSGQSNMQMPLSAILSDSEVAKLANLPYLRILGQSISGLDGRTGYPYEPADELTGAYWFRADQAKLLANCSAIGFFFARKLQLQLKIPIGLIESALGASCIHSWLSRPTIEQNPVILDHLKELDFYRERSTWSDSSDWEETQYQPAALYNSKIAPLKDFFVNGVLWYQGESDFQYPDYYRKALEALVGDWQKILRPVGRHNELAWLLVQLAPAFYGQSRFTALAEFNEMLSEIKAKLSGPVALLPIYDLPPDYVEAVPDWRHPLHPVAKEPVGSRLCELALALCYKKKGPASAPTCRDIEVVGNKMILSFAHCGDGLRIKGDEHRLTGFAICGADRIFLPARAHILYGVRVMVWNDQIRDPQAVTYAFQDLNQEANLVSRNGLPVVPFRSDRFASQYYPPLEWMDCESTSLWATPDRTDLLSTGWHPVWRAVHGSCVQKIEWAHASEGAGSLHLDYTTNEQRIFSLEPRLDYASKFPPVDFSFYSALEISLFNANQREKTVAVLLANAPEQHLTPVGSKVTLKSDFRWQTFRFSLDNMAERNRVTRLVLTVGDSAFKGEIYIGQFTLVV